MSSRQRPAFQPACGRSVVAAVSRMMNALVSVALPLIAATSSASSAVAQQLPGTLLVTEFSQGSVVDVLAGGDFTTAPRFATGLASPIGLCVGPNNDIYVGEFNSGEVTIITSGGDFSMATPFATGLSSIASLACDATHVYALGLYNGLVFDITAGGNFAMATPFATLTGSMYYASIKLDESGKLWVAGSSGVWDISMGGTFDNTSRYATDNVLSSAGFGILGSTLYVGRYSANVVAVAMGADLSMTTAFATVPQGLSGFAASNGHAFAITQGNVGSQVFDVTAGGDFSMATPHATGIGQSYFGGVIYFSACGDGVLQSGLGEECDNAAMNDDSMPNACRTNCHSAHCGDGIVDTGEACDEGASNNDMGMCHTDCKLACADADADGSCDDADECDSDPMKSAAGSCGCGVADTDTDTDGTPDCNDMCANDMAKTAPGDCGCGNMDTDSDSDGTADCSDMCPNDAQKTAPGTCGCGDADTDSDSDGTADCDDMCANDAQKTAPGVCGCGESDADSDEDGVADCDDVCLGRDSSGDDDADKVCNDRDDKVLVLGTKFAGKQSDCKDGGVRLTIGTDADGSRTLSDQEIEQMLYICNGVSANVAGAGFRVTTIEPKSQQCAYGGLLIETGRDEDRDGTLVDAEVDTTNIACYANGLAVRTTTLPSGSNECPAGGVKIEIGIDANGDYELSSEEAMQTNSVCQTASELLDTESLPVGDAACEHGGVRVLTGADDGAPSGTAGDGVLQPEEVDSKHEVCVPSAPESPAGGDAGVAVDAGAGDNTGAGESKDGGGSCSVRSVGRGSPGLGTSVLLFVAACLMRRRRARTAR